MCNAPKDSEGNNIRCGTGGSRVAGCGSPDRGDDAGDTVEAEKVINCGIPVSPSEPVERAVAVNQPAVELLLSLGWRIDSPGGRAR